VVVNPAPTSPALPALSAKPKHVAIIMDGNGRWAQARGLSRSDGHRAGAEAIRPVIRRFAEHQVPVITLFGFSTENWGRPRTEIETILKLGAEFIDGGFGCVNRNITTVFGHEGRKSALMFFLFGQFTPKDACFSPGDGL